MNVLKRFISKIKPKAKYILGVLGIAAVISQGAFAINKLSATAPRFNFLSGDYELLRGLNQTAGESAWKDPVSGSTGDVFKGIVYYHNGVVDTIAENTRIKVIIPVSTSGNTAVLSARVSADNAETITDTIVDGVIVGQSGLTAGLDSSANLELVPGSVLWYPNQLNNPNVPSALPFGQTGDEIIGANGINLGNINGCWEYAGYVVFSFRTLSNTAPGLNVDKIVKNVTAGGDYAELVNASENDEVEFKIDLSNPGNEDLDNVNFRDSLPTELTYTNGSMKLYRNGSSAPEILAESAVSAIFADGWDMGSLQAGSGKTSTFVFSVTAPENIAVTSEATNTAYVASGTLSDQDIAKVNLVPSQAPHIIKHKTVRNLTTGQVAETRFIGGRYVLAVDSVAGDKIEYTLSVTNDGNDVSEEFVIEDGVTDILEYADVIAISNDGEIVSGTTGNDATLVRYPVVNVAPGESVSRTFTVKVKDPIPSNPPSGFSYDMQMYNVYGDEVIVEISRPTPPVQLPILRIEKLVRDFTVNQLDFVDHNEAITGDTLEYLIRFSNVGDAPADQVKFTDILPANTQYISGTTIISINGGDEHTLSDGIVAGGVMLDTIAAGDSGYIKFKVITMAGILAGETLVNTASITDDGVSKFDTASTTFSAPVVLPPVTPLPRTGADSILISLAAALGVVTVAYRVAKLS